MVLYYLLSRDLKKIEGHHFILRAQKNSQDSVKITDQLAVPKCYCRIERVTGVIWETVLSLLPEELARAARVLDPELGRTMTPSRQQWLRVRRCQGLKLGEECTCASLELGARKSKKMQGSGRSRCILILPNAICDRPANEARRPSRPDSGGRIRNRAYECPACKARVHYRRAMGLSPEPGFAHNAHVARQDCHLYHPSFGVESQGSGGEALATEPINEIDLCLDDPLRQ